MKRIATALVAVVAGAIALAGCGGNPMKNEQVTFTVVSKERGSGSGENKQPTLVWGKLEDGSKETFKIEDSLWEGNLASGDTYGMLVPGDTFTCTANGFREKWMSEYRNLTDCKEASNG